MIPLSQGPLLGSFETHVPWPTVGQASEEDTDSTPQTPAVTGDGRNTWGSQNMWGQLGQWGSQEAGIGVGTRSPAHCLTQQLRQPRYLGGSVQFEGWLLSHTAEVGPDFLLVAFIVRIIQVVVVS